MWPNRTHQNGTSIDFASPLKKNDQPYHGDQWKGIHHYGIKFDEQGRCKGNKKISINFEAMLNIFWLPNLRQEKEICTLKKCF